MTNRKIVPSREEVLDHLTRFSREPFQEILADIIGAKPSPEVLEAFADANPDKWTQMLKVAASLAGYADQHTIEHNIMVEVRQLGDAELVQKLSDLRGEVVELAKTEYGDAGEAQPSKAEPDKADTSEAEPSKQADK